MHNPIELLPKAQELTVTVNGDKNAFEQANYSKMFGIDGGEDKSPEIAWSGAPSDTKSYVVSMYDPDAPTESGFWHWMVKDIPADQTGLVADAGNMETFKLPAGAKNVLNDARTAGYIGAAPPAGETHRYHLLVSALDVAALDIDSQATPAFAEFMMGEHVLARGLVVLKGEAGE